MKLRSIFSMYAAALSASALSVPSGETEKSIGHELENRAQSETVSKIWSLENSQIALNYAGVFAAMAGGIAAIITATSSGSSGCTITAEVVKVESRATDAIGNYNLTAISDSLYHYGYEVNPFAWSTNDTTIEYLGALKNNETSISDLAVTESSLQFKLEAFANHTDSHLASRSTTLRKNEIEVYYHATGKCYTTHTKKEVAKGVDEILNRISDQDYYASCWALRFGHGSWHGHLKLLGLWSNGDVSSEGLKKSCEANS
ncbi:hypothetical protein N7456_006131 [Penicillium angulare]|uniref:Uncharacterized protein n=1 Tax=Penicillium angulare TaxID=116970 RepID=A0A9W9KKX9_9EURO|nr:hypothetical protein N7456_006131 [Penicillium angulare]